MKPDKPRVVIYRTFDDWSAAVDKNLAEVPDPGMYRVMDGSFVRLCRIAIDGSIPGLRRTTHAGAYHNPDDGSDA